jgi:excisionase family DNA binding protein
MVTEEKLVYTIPEVSALLGISHIHGYLMAKRGEIPTIRLGRRIVVPKVALEKLLDCAGNDNKVES